MCSPHIQVSDVLCYKQIPITGIYASWTEIGLVASDEQPRFVDLLFTLSGVRMDVRLFMLLIGQPSQVITEPDVRDCVGSHKEHATEYLVIGQKLQDQFLSRSINTSYRNRFVTKWSRAWVDNEVKVHESTPHCIK